LARDCGELYRREGERVSYYDADPWANHELNEIKCAECGEEFDQQDQEGGNICPACIEKEGENEVQAVRR
jgi:Zn finger protein HypA/HybF involved in hydrogenase expression